MSTIQEYRLVVLGIEVSFRAQVGEDRVNKAKKLVEKKFEKMRLNGGRASKELLLTLLVLGLADDLLQAEAELDEKKKRLSVMLDKIEKIV